MKALATALLAAAGLAVSSARADHESRVIVSGHIHLGTPAPVYTAPAYCPPAPPVHYVPAPTRYVPARGYWKDVVVKTWVPERWSVRHDRWGRPVRNLEPGHFAYRTERVWVDGRDGHGYGNDRYGHGNDYRGGYGYRR